MKTRKFCLSVTDQRILLELVRREITALEAQRFPSAHLLDRLERLYESLKKPVGEHNG